MIKLAAILTTAAIACSGGATAAPTTDCTASRIAQTRCLQNSNCIQSVCPQYKLPSCGDVSIDCGGNGLFGGSCGTTQTPSVDQDQDCQTPQTPSEDTGAQTPSDDEESTDVSMSAYVSEVVRLVNEARAEAGVPALKTDALLMQAAQVRAQEIDESFSHTRPDGSSCFTVLKEMGISYRACGENIAKGSPTPQRVVDGWMNSAGHRKNILNANFTTIGVGYYVDAAGTAHWSQLFTA